MKLRKNDIVSIISFVLMIGLVFGFVAFGKSLISELNKCEQCQYDAGVVLEESTCRTHGSIKYTCELCGYEDIQELPVSLCEYTKLIEEVAPTCEEDGYKLYKCKWCKNEHIEYSKKLGHFLTDPQHSQLINEPSSCYDPFIYRQICLNGCGYYEDFEINRNGECEFEFDMTNPTYCAMTCIYCGYVSPDYDLVQHSFEGAIFHEPNNCLEYAYTSNECGNCGYVKYEVHFQGECTSKLINDYGLYECIYCHKQTYDENEIDMIIFTVSYGSTMEETFTCPYGMTWNDIFDSSYLGTSKDNFIIGNNTVYYCGGYEPIAYLTDIIQGRNYKC